MHKISIEEIYRQQYAHFGRMNGHLYRLPILFSTLIGGLWFFGFKAIENSLFALLVFFFTFLLSIIFILMMHRFRLAFSGYITNLNKMDGEFAVSLKEKIIPSSISLIQFTLGISSFISFIFAISVLCSEWV